VARRAVLLEHRLSTACVPLVAERPAVLLDHARAVPFGRAEELEGPVADAGVGVGGELLPARQV